MFLKRLATKTIEANLIRFTIPLRYLDEEDHIADDFPGRHDGDKLTMLIGLDDGIVRDWPKGRVEQVYEKVCDEGVYTLLNDDGTEVTTSEGYVPGFFPEDHYGDYVILGITGDGKVTGWPPKARAVQEWIDTLEDLED